MNATINPLRTRLAALRKDPRISALTLLGPGGQVFELVDELVSEVERLQRQVQQLQAHLDGLGALRVNQLDGGR